MTRIEYTYIIDDKLMQDSISVEWIAKVNALKYKVKFAEDESSIVNNKILSIVCKTKDNIFKFQDVKFLDKDDFIVGSDVIYEFMFKQIIKF